MTMAITGVSLAEMDDIKVSIDGKYIRFNDTTGYPFIDENNRIQVPFRATLETIGAKVSWQNEPQIAIAERDGIRIEAHIGQPYVLKNQEKVMNNTAAVINDGRTYLPIRIIMESLGYNVSWSDEEKTVEILKQVEEEKKQRDHQEEKEENTKQENQDDEKVEKKKPQVEIKAPSKTKEKGVAIKIITDKDNSVYLNDERVELDDNNEYMLKLSDTYNDFKVEVVNEKGIKTVKTFTIEKTNEEFYFDVKYGRKKNDNKWVNISGRTNKSSKVKIDGDKIILNDRGEFEYRFTDLQPGENTILVSCENSEFDENVEKRITVFYEGSQSEDDPEKEEALVKEFTDNLQDDKDLECEEPVIKLDNEIPKVTDKLSLTISGTVENAKYIVVNGGITSTSGKMKLEDNKFSHTIELLNSENGGQQSKKGVFNFIQIYAVNEGKIKVMEYEIYFKK